LHPFTNNSSMSASFLILLDQSCSQYCDISLLEYTPGMNIIIDNTFSVVEVTPIVPTRIPTGWYVCQVDDRAISALPSDKVQLDMTFHTPTEQVFDNKYDCIIGGAGLLIQNKEVVADRLYQEFSQGHAIVHCHDEIAADFYTAEMQKWMIELRH